MVKNALLRKLNDRTAVIGIMGLGYVGLPLMLRFAEVGYRVIGIDTDAVKVARLQKGRSYIEHISDALIAKARATGFEATTDFALSKQADALLICVPTPLNRFREPDLSFVTGTMDSLVPHLRRGQLVCLESTTYPGTTEEELKPRIESRNLKVGTDIFLCFSPEREDPGNREFVTRTIPKICGGVTAACLEVGLAVYGQIIDKVIPVSSTRAAEMTKLLENIYRCVNIALVNELKMLCLRMGIDIWEVIHAASTKPYGFQPFYPGPGLGGHCIPIDPFYLSWKAKEWDFRTRFIELAGEINTAMPTHICTAIANALNSQRKAINGSKIMVLGAAYKKDIDDLRESPSLTIIELLRKAGADVSYNDPYIPVIGRGRHYDLEMQSTGLEQMGKFDCVVIVTDHSEYDYASIVRESQLVVDTRNATKGIDSAKIWPA